MPEAIGTVIGIAAFGGACAISGVLLARSRRKGSGEQEGQVGADVLRDGMPLRFTVLPSKPPVFPRGIWTGRILHSDGAALSLSAEWEGDFPGQTPPASLQTGESLVVTVTGLQAVYRFEAQTLDIREDTERPNKRLIVIALPAKVTRFQRRRSPRQSLTVPATLELAEKQPASLPQSGTIRDISSGGLRADIGSVITVAEAARLVETYKIGTILRIRLPLPLLPGEGILARVCSCERTAQRGGLGVRIACEFLPMLDFDADFLLTQLFRTQGKLHYTSD